MLAGDLYLCLGLVQWGPLEKPCSHDEGVLGKHHLRVYLTLKSKLNVGRVFLQHQNVNNLLYSFIQQGEGRED